MALSKDPPFHARPATLRTVPPPTGTVGAAPGRAGEGGRGGVAVAPGDRGAATEPGRTRHGDEGASTCDHHAVLHNAAAPPPGSGATDAALLPPDDFPPIPRSVTPPAA